MSSNNQSLTDTIKELQDRIKDLEHANNSFRREIAVYRQEIANIQKNSFSNGQIIYNNSEKTTQMIEGATETLRDLRIIKLENQSLQKQIKSAEEELKKLLTENVKLSSQNNKELIHLESNKKIEDHYISFLLQIVMPNMPKSYVKLQTEFKSSVNSQKDASISSKVQFLLQQLKQLPRTISSQPFNVQKTMILTLNEGKKLIQNLEFEIDYLYRSDRNSKLSQIKERQNYIEAISQSMNHICF